MKFGFGLYLGFLGLLGILILLLIYFLKPNYQQKVVSSTFLWKLSLKYKKKRIPINKIRNLLLVLCQVLLITICSFILAYPQLTDASKSQGRDEGIVIIDASASMNAQTAGESRFQRAISEAKIYIQNKFQDNGYITVVIAGRETNFLSADGKEFVSCSKTDREPLINALESATCSYGTCDPEAALEKVEPILASNPRAEVYFFTATEYRESGIVNVVDVKPDNEEGGDGSVSPEWNAAILTCESSLDENEILFTVELACYDREQDIDLVIDIVGANDFDGKGGDDYTDLHYPVRCLVDANGKAIPAKFEFKASDCGVATPIISFKRVFFRFEGINDSLESDNTYYLYGGEREEIKIQLYSSDANSFFYAGFTSLKKQLAEDLDLTIDRVSENEEPTREGYDFYVYEHVLPDIVKKDGLPTDGVIFLCDPDSVALETGLMLDVAETNTSGGLVSVKAGVEHAITQYLRMDRIKLTKYRKINSYNESYQSLMTCEDSPVMVVREDATTRMVVMTFSVNYSTITIEREFMILLYNMIDHFVPLTLEKNVSYVGEEVTFQARGDQLKITGEDVEETVTEFPGKYTFEKPGTYLFTQQLLSQSVKEDYLYVRITPDESNIFRVRDRLTEYEIGSAAEMEPLDLLLYFAIAMLVLLLVEWWLQSREYLA